MANLSCHTSVNLIEVVLTLLQSWLNSNPKARRRKLPPQYNLLLHLHRGPKIQGTLLLVLEVACLDRIINQMVIRLEGIHLVRKIIVQNCHKYNYKHF